MKVRASSWLGTAVAAVLSCGTVANAGFITVFFDAASQNGGVNGNMGFSYIPLDTLGQFAPLVLTAGSLTDTTDPFDPFAPITPGTIFFNGFGAGVQDELGFGTELISGMLGGGVVEQLVITFANPATPTGLVLTLTDYSTAGAFRDDPAIIVYLTDGTVFELDDGDIDEVGGNTGILDFSTVLNPDQLVQQIVVRETENHFALHSISFTPIPAPGTLVLLAMAGVMLGRSRRRRRLV